ncbi:hypothetical protein ACJ73_05904 [Blastomyces percursus]|uniref:Uncharacterized protein n=1 Tax=Blastomyces percursus TaxID=1658174 RepID=A0A1J9Q2F3_9EURO|nr:hypothetical protein ACJ73_05904 [Blastomyces percursus]
MKLFRLLTAFFAAVVINAPTTAAENASENAAAQFSEFYPVKLPLPPNWVYGDKLGDRILKVFDASYTQYNASTWLHNTVLQCVDFYYCNVTMIYTVGTGKDKSWIGVIFQGPHATKKDFIRQPGVGQSAAYNRFRVNATEGVDSNAFEVY